MHGKSKFKHYKRETNSILFWGLLVPLIIGTISVFTNGVGLLLFGGYPILILRIYINLRRKGQQHLEASIFAVNCILAKVPQQLGSFKFAVSHIKSQSSSLIEYK